MNTTCVLGMGNTENVVEQLHANDNPDATIVTFFCVISSRDEFDCFSVIADVVAMVLVM